MPLPPARNRCSRDICSLPEHQNGATTYSSTEGCGGIVIIHFMVTRARYSPSVNLWIDNSFLISRRPQVQSYLALAAVCFFSGDTYWHPHGWKCPCRPTALEIHAVHTFRKRLAAERLASSCESGTFLRARAMLDSAVRRDISAIGNGCLGSRIGLCQRTRSFVHHQPRERTTPSPFVFIMLTCNHSSRAESSCTGPDASGMFGRVEPAHCFRESLLPANSAGLQRTTD